jgi:hypothetical protein
MDVPLVQQNVIPVAEMPKQRPQRWQKQIAQAEKYSDPEPDPPDSPLRSRMPVQ